MRALSNIVTPGYFRTMAIPLRAGQDFAAFDDPAAPPQVVVKRGVRAAGTWATRSRSGAGSRTAIGNTSSSASPARR